MQTNRGECGVSPLGHLKAVSISLFLTIAVGTPNLWGYVAPYWCEVLPCSDALNARPPAWPPHTAAENPQRNSQSSVVWHYEVHLHHGYLFYCDQLSAERQRELETASETFRVRQSERVDYVRADRGSDRCSGPEVTSRSFDWLITGPLHDNAAQRAAFLGNCRVAMVTEGGEGYNKRGLLMENDLFWLSTSMWLSAMTHTVRLNASCKETVLYKRYCLSVFLHFIYTR